MTLETTCDFVRSTGVAGAFKKALASSANLRVAVAYLSDTGVEEIINPLRRFIRKGHHCKLGIGLSTQYITKPKGVDMLLDLEEQKSSRNLELRFTNRSDFHPKFFLFGDQRDIPRQAIIGSSNLTGGGTRSNIEANVWIRSTTATRVLLDSLQEYFDNEIWDNLEQLGRDRYEQEDYDRRYASRSKKRNAAAGPGKVKLTPSFGGSHQRQTVKSKEVYGYMLAYTEHNIDKDLKSVMKGDFWKYTQQRGLPNREYKIIVEKNGYLYAEFVSVERRDGNFGIYEGHKYNCMYRVKPDSVRFYSSNPYFSRLVGKRGTRYAPHFTKIAYDRVLRGIKLEEKPRDFSSAEHGAVRDWLRKISQQGAVVQRRKRSVYEINGKQVNVRFARDGRWFNISNRYLKSLDAFVWISGNSGHFYAIPRAGMQNLLEKTTRNKWDQRPEFNIDPRTHSFLPGRGKQTDISRYYNNSNCIL